MEKDLKLFWKLLQKLNYVLDRKRKRMAGGVFFLIFIGALMETLGVSIILPFIQMLTDSEGLMKEPYIKFLSGTFKLETEESIIIMLGFAVILLYLLKNVFLSFSGYIQVRFRTGMGKELQRRMMSSYMKQSYSFFLDTSSGNIVQGTMGDVPKVQNFVENLMTVLSETLVVLLIISYLFRRDKLITIGIMAVALLTFMIMGLGLKKRLSRLGEQDYLASAKLNNDTLEIVRGIKDIIIRGKQDVFLKKFDEHVENKRQIQSYYQFLAVLPRRCIEAVCICGIMAVVMVRIHQGIDKSTFVPGLAVFAVAAFRILPSLSRIINGFNDMMFNRYAIDNIYDNIKKAKECESESEGLRSAVEDAGTYVFHDSICVKGIYWNYEGTENEILCDLNMVIRKGESVGIIGKSGAGKTTLADIFLGLFKPVKGTVEIDGNDIFDMPEFRRRMIGYVPQNVFLRDHTIRENVAFGEEEIEDERIWKALESASLAQFVKELPEGLDTLVGENGIKLSGGQKQRIAIARALYFEPAILVLDEATSSLDNETEHDVMEAIEDLQGTITMIIIAHRLTTIRKCDRIYEIRDHQAFEVVADELQRTSI